MEMILRIFRFALLSAASCLPFTIFMKTPYEIFVSLRYLKTKKRYGTISLNTFISIAGVVIGVATSIITLAVMTDAALLRKPGNLAGDAYSPIGRRINARHPDNLHAVGVIPICVVEQIVLKHKAECAGAGALCCMGYKRRKHTGEPHDRQRT